MVPQTVPERLVPATDVPLDRRSSAIAQTILSRGNLTNIIETFGLYPAERSRMATEDVIDIMKAAIEIKPAERNTIRVAFSYFDAELAHKVTADLVSRFMAENTRDRTSIAMGTSQFLRDAVSNAGRDLDACLDALRVASQARNGYERAKLDADIARQRYIDMRGKLAEAEMAEELEKRQQGAQLEVLEPASHPSDDREMMVLSPPAGLLVGALFGLLISWLSSLRVRQVEAEA